jgi:hypothetical protein
MDYKKLREDVREIEKIASELPEGLREKCFELLLQRRLDEVAPARPRDEDEVKKEKERKPGELPIPAKVRALMQRTGVSEEALGAVLLYEDGEVHFVREPRPKKVARGQIEWALLLALKSAMLGKGLVVDPEDVRSVCVDKGFYDKANFAAYFKTKKNAALFRGLVEPQGEARPLTSEGEETLGDLVKRLAEKGE